MQLSRSERSAIEETRWCLESSVGIREKEGGRMWAFGELRIMKSASSDDAEAARIGVFLTDVAALWIVNT